MSTEPSRISMPCRAELEKAEQWHRDRGDLRAAAGVRCYLDYMALPAAQRQAIDVAVELRHGQLHELAALCLDADIALLAAQEIMGNTSADGFGIRLSAGQDMYGADIDRDQDGLIRLEVWSDGWPYRRPIMSTA